MNFSYIQKIPDSLISKLERAAEDTSKVNLLLEISKELRPYNPNEALKYSEQSLLLSQKIEYKVGVGKTYNELGIIYNNKGRFDLALDLFLKCMSYYEEIDDKLGLASVNNSIGRLWYDTKDYEKALKYFREGLKLHEQLKDTLRIAMSMVNIGSMLDHLGRSDSALTCYDFAYDVITLSGDSSKLPGILLNLGEHYEILNDHQLALEYYNRALIISKTKDISPRIADSYDQLGCFYFRKANYNMAISYLDSAMNLSKELTSIDRIRDITGYLSDAYKKNGEWRKALEYSEWNNILTDSIKSMNIDLQLTELEWERERDLERQLQEKVLQRQKLLRNFSFIALFLVIIILAVLYRNYRMKQKTNKLLAEIDELKSRMFSNISHEFRTPLTLILGPLEEMIEADASGRPSGKNLKMMQRNAKRMLDLVNQMLDLSKMDAGKLKIELIQSDLIQVLRTMILSFSSLAEQKHIKFKYEMPDQSLMIYYDPDKLEKIINNLLSNAFKFTPEHGTVSVHVTISYESRATIRPPFNCEIPVLDLIIEDTGKGIPEDQLDKIFDRFQQVEGTSEIDRIGTGIGLALVKELVELMHGKISAESALGKGTKFHVHLPLGKDHLRENEYILKKADEITDEKKKVTMQGQISEPDSEQQEYAGGKEDKPIVLVVDDHPDIRSHIHQYLKEFRVLEASDGVEGLEISIENIPDLIITDLMMPNMDGVEFCKKLKTDERTSHIPVIMLTAKASVENRIEGLETGADDYITKPFNMKELFTRINNLIDQRRKLRERFSREVTLQPKEIAVTSADERFLNRIIEIIENKMGDDNFDVAALQKEIGLSHMQMFRKLKALTDQAPGDFIRTIRLKRSASLLEQKFGNVAEVAYEVGFNNLSYFAKCFKEMFGQSPSEYIKNKS